MAPKTVAFLEDAGYEPMRIGVDDEDMEHRWKRMLLPSFAGPAGILVGQDDGRFLQPSTSPLVAYMCTVETHPACYRHK